MPKNGLIHIYVHSGISIFYSITLFTHYNKWDTSLNHTKLSFVLQFFFLIYTLIYKPKSLSNLHIFRIINFIKSDNEKD